MTSSSDLEQIETRTLSLVRDFSFLHADDPVANSCKAVADAVAQQAVTSSEGGKRLRALLTLDAFRAFAPQDVAERDMDAVLDLACAIEVFQTGALVHDDIIDDSDLRRGKPSAHRARPILAFHLRSRQSRRGRPRYCGGGPFSRYRRRLGSRRRGQPLLQPLPHSLGRSIRWGCIRHVRHVQRVRHARRVQRLRRVRHARRVQRLRHVRHVRRFRWFRAMRPFSQRSRVRRLLPSQAHLPPFRPPRLGRQQFLLRLGEKKASC